MKLFGRSEKPATPSMPDTSGWERSYEGDFSRVRMFNLDDSQWRFYAENQNEGGPETAPAHAHEVLRKTLLGHSTDEMDRFIVDSLAPPLDQITEPTLMQVHHQHYENGRPAGGDYGSYVIGEELIAAYDDIPECDPRFNRAPTSEPAADTPVAPVVDIFTGKEL